jgi:hypothetical protein
MLCGGGKELLPAIHLGAEEWVGEERRDEPAHLARGESAIEF